MPKLVPLNKRHRRCRQTNLSTLLSSVPDGTQSLLNRTTRRKVSEEDMQTSSSSTNAMITEQECNYEQPNLRKNWSNYGPSLTSCMSPHVVSTPSQLLLEATNSMNTQSIDSELKASDKQSSTFKLKRPAASCCLADLANCISPESSANLAGDVMEKSNCKTPRPRSASPPPSPYGHFVDILIPDDEDHSELLLGAEQDRSFIPFSVLPGPRARVYVGQASDPYPRIYPRVSKRQRTSSSTTSLAFHTQYHINSKTAAITNNPGQRPAVKNFVLSFPELDETADRLGSLSF